MLSPYVISEARAEPNDRLRDWCFGFVTIFILVEPSDCHGRRMMERRTAMLSLPRPVMLLGTALLAFGRARAAGRKNAPGPKHPSGLARR